jgi:hypothetical protein
VRIALKSYIKKWCGKEGKDVDVVEHDVPDFDKIEEIGKKEFDEEINNELNDSTRKLNSDNASNHSSPQKKTTQNGSSKNLV